MTAFHCPWMFTMLLLCVMISLQVDMTCSIVCDSCEYQTLNDTDSIECREYYSCKGATIVQGNEDGYDGLFCRGSYSCANASKISLQNDAALDCTGSFSCAYANNIEDELTMTVYPGCDGEQSCSHATVLSMYGLNCDGDRACAHANLTLRKNLYVGGHLGALNAVIHHDNKSNNDTNYHFEGAFSGYNAVVDCPSGENCNINCWGNTCVNLTYTGDGAVVVNCNYSQKCQVCPDGYDPELILMEILGIDINVNNDFVPNLLFTNASMTDTSTIVDTCYANVCLNIFFKQFFKNFESNPCSLLSSVLL